MDCYSQQVGAFVDNFNKSKMSNVKILPKSVLDVEVLIFCPYLHIFVRLFDQARRAAATDWPTTCMHVVNHLNPKLLSFQFYSQIEAGTPAPRALLHSDEIFTPTLETLRR